jgi:hypothetical protein
MPELTVNMALTEKLAAVCVVGVDATVSPLKVNVPLFVMPQPTADIVIVPPEGANVWLALTVNVAAMEKLAEGCVAGVPAIVKPLKVSVPLFVIPHPVPVIVIVPAVGVSVVLAFTVSVPLTEKFAEGCVVGVTAIVKPLKVSTLLFVIAHAVPAIVMVPPVGANVWAALTVNVALIEKLAEGCVVGVPTIVNPQNVSTLLFVIPHPVPDIEIVPAVGANVVLAFTVSVPVTEKFAAGCVVGVPAIVKLLKVSTLLFVIAHAVPVIVMVPPVGANVTPAFTVSVPATE